jgi:sterol desaturase/sphingolipid hydroxylase (fatty acid hydroxylase superfamily)
MGARRGTLGDPTVAAVPAYFATMAAEAWYLRRRRGDAGPTSGDYEARDTAASLSMGVGSLLVPLVAPKLLKPLSPGRGRWGTVLVAAALGMAAATTAADLVARRAARRAARPQRAAEVPERAVVRQPATGGLASKVAAAGGVASLALGGVALTTAWASTVTPERLYRRRVLPDLGASLPALAAAVVGWDFIYYWNHRFMHESRSMWAIHVVHHSSEHYNLSTALRQPVAEPLGTFLPYSALCLLGVSPELLTTARGINLLWQYWIHTEAIGTMGASEAVLNTPSHHRVHHGSNPRYLDRNHASMLIVWDRLFGTFEPETEPVVYGLTKNLGSFNPAVIIGHEYAAIVRDVASAASWRERLAYLLRGPGWAVEHRGAASEASDATAAPAAPDPDVI